MNHAPAAAWTREGYYEDGDGHILSVTRMDDVDEPGWYVGCMLGTEFIDDSWGGMLSQVGDALQGSLPSSGSQEALTVTVTEEAVITLLLDESADFVAVFEEDPGCQNPVMNFIGEYQCDRAHALVECFGKDEAWITIEWGGSATELARWIIVGRLDTETMTVEYSGCAKTIVTFDESGEELSQEAEYEDGTGTIVFNDDGTFTWHEDQAEYGTDMVFEWVSVTESGE